MPLFDEYADRTHEIMVCPWVGPDDDPTWEEYLERNAEDDEDYDPDPDWDEIAEEYWT